MGKLFRKNSPSKGSHPPRKESSTMHLDDGGLRFELSKLFLGQKFAHGAFSKIYHGIYNEEAVAVKMVREDDDEFEGPAPRGSSIGGVLAARLEKLYDSEVSLLSRLRHPNVVKFVGACKQYPVYCVVTEYVDQGSLRGYLHKLECKPLPLEQVVAMALDIARGMEYIHSQGVIHRDLKPENVLMDKDFRLKIADFGIACEEAYCDPFANEPAAGTYRWMAPEVIKRKPYGRKVDVFSFGLILWELVAGTFPFEELTPIQAAVAVANKNLRPLIPKDCPSAMRALIEQCWSLQPHKRPEFQHIVKVLEQFQSSLAGDGKPTCQYDRHKKRILQWINQKLVHQHPNPSPTCQDDHQKKGTHKPKFFRECRLVF